jgi:regulatory protein
MNKTITAIKIQKRNPERVNIYLDGDYAFGLAKILAAWLRVGEVLSEERICKLREEDYFETAYQKALHFLSFRPRSEDEIRRRLRQDDIDDLVIDSVLGRLRQAGLVDDLQFAQTWIENRSAFRPRSHRLLAYELRQKGIAADTISTSLDDLVDDEVLAYQAAARQAGKYEKMEWVDFRKKLINFLGRRGFSYSVSAPVVLRVWKEKQSNFQNAVITNNLFEEE